MAQFIGIEVENIEAVTAWLVNLPTPLIDAAADGVLDYWRGVLRNPANYAPYRYVSRAEAYPDAPAGPGWFSERQRRYVMARIRSGEITTPYQRTNTLAKSWQKIGSGVDGFLVNTAPYASFVIDPTGQSRHEKAVGWWTAPGPLNDPARLAGAVRAAEVEIDKAIKRNRP